MIRMMLVGVDQCRMFGSQVGFLVGMQMELVPMMLDDLPFQQLIFRAINYELMGSMRW